MGGMHWTRPQLGSIKVEVGERTAEENFRAIPSWIKGQWPKADSAV